MWVVRYHTVGISKTSWILFKMMMTFSIDDIHSNDHDNVNDNGNDYGKQQ